jgi:Rrf2 family transcriptional regulator, nitric oxide-sensitive transcriptional repressor
VRLTKQTSHAIRILIDCARGGHAPIKVADIAQRLEITQQNVFKLVHILSHAGFVKGSRGRYGGVQLARAASAIKIGDVVRATEVTHIEVEDGGLGRKVTGRPSQLINSVLDNALDAFITVLDQHTIADMAKSATATASLTGGPQSAAKPNPKPRRAAKPRATPRPASTPSSS